MATRWKKVSKYISDEDAITLQTLIKKRRTLQKQLQELTRLIPKTSVPDYRIQKGVTEYSYRTQVDYGESLLNRVKAVKEYKKRDCFATLNEYLFGNTIGKVLILYGLRRTGKTTLMRQAIFEMSKSDKERCAYIQLTEKDELKDLNYDLRQLESKGYKYIFLDEVTLLRDFIEGAALFSDIYCASDIKIVLSGTDSLGFMFAEDEQLYDRCFMIHTTFIPYREFERVLGKKGIDEYIRYGGTMSLGGVNYNTRVPFSTENSTSEYVNSAIAKNIQHSLKYYQYEGHFRNLYDLYEHNELTSSINRVVEDMNHRFTLEVLTKDFQSNDLHISQNNLRKDKEHGSLILDQIDEVQLTTTLKNLLDIKNKDEQLVNLKEYHQIEIQEYLKLLDLIDYISIETIPPTSEKKHTTIFVQPGMRYSIAEALVKNLIKDSLFQDLSLEERTRIVKRILSEIKGRIVEDLVLLETKNAFPNKEVFKLQLSIGEFDMVIFDEEDLSCEIFEIKYNSSIVEEQYKNLINKEYLEKTTFRFGTIKNRYVIYRGENQVLPNGIQYVNVEDYLNHLTLK